MVTKIRKWKFQSKRFKIFYCLLDE